MQDAMNFTPHYRNELPQDAASIEHIHDVTFGPGRYARAAFKLREGVPADMALSFVAEINNHVIGSVRLTPMRVDDTPLILLGPLAVLPTFTRAGIGGALMRMSMEAARRQGHKMVLLVGDLPFYYPFGFRRVSVQDIEMPLPVDPERLLVAELVAGAAKGLKGKAQRAPLPISCEGAAQLAVNG